MDSSILWVVIDFSNSILSLVLELIHDLHEPLNSGRWNAVDSIEGIMQWASSSNHSLVYLILSSQSKLID